MQDSLAKPPSGGAELARGSTPVRDIGRARRIRSTVGKLAVTWPALVALAGGLHVAYGLPGLTTAVLMLGAPLLWGLHGVMRRLRPQAQGGSTLSPADWVDAQACEGPGLLWPVTGASLLAPLTVHGVMWLIFGVGLGSRPWVDFDLWIALSVPLTAAAHWALISYARRYVHGLLADPLARPETLGPKAWRTVAAVTTAGAVPGVVLLGIPTTIVGLTALAVVPLMFTWAARTADRECAALLPAARRFAELAPETFETETRRLMSEPRTREASRGHLLQLLSIMGSREAIRGGVQDVLQSTLTCDGRSPSPNLTKLALELSDRLSLALEPDVAEALSQHPDTTVGVALAKSLGRRPEPFSQAILRKMLGGREPDVLRAAVQGLSKIGSQADIADLGGLTQRTYHSAIRGEARSAIRAIRDRRGGAGPAALSFPPQVEPSGSLSLSSVDGSPEQSPDGVAG